VCSALGDTAPPSSDLTSTTTATAAAATTLLPARRLLIPDHSALHFLVPVPSDGPKPISETATSFSKHLYDHISGSLLLWLSSIRGGFIIEALAKVPGVGPSLLKELQSHREEVRGCGGSGGGNRWGVLMMTDGICGGGAFLS